MKINITTTMEPTAEQVRRGLEDSAALARMAKRWPVLLSDGKRAVGKAGPAFRFSAKARG